MLTIKSDRNALLDPLQAVTGIVERRHTLPILSNVLIETSNDYTTFTTSDLEVQIKTQAKVVGANAGESITVGARKFQDILRSLPDTGEITLDAKDSRLQLKAGKSRFNLQTLPAADFPKLSETGESITSFAIQQSVLRALVEKVQFAMAHQDIRYYLNGLLMAVDGNSLVMVATDGHRLSFSSAAITLNFNKCEAIIPRKTVGELAKLLAANGEEKTVSVSLRSNQVKFNIGDTELISKVIDGKFPDYGKVIPVGYSKVIRLNRQTLQQALQRAAILSNDKIRGVRLVVTKDNLSMSCTNNEQEEAQEELAIDYNSDPLDIGFNVAYILDALNHLTSEEVDWSFGDSNSSSLFTIPGDADFKYVIMPMRI
jgi:DNA polymerase III subunit beta